MRQSSRFVLLAAAFAAVLSSARAADPPPPRPSLLTKVYPVADLVIPVGDHIALWPSGATKPASCAAPTGAPMRQTCHEQLIKLITSTVAPQSWVESGGCGTIDYFPIGMALAVNQPAGVQEQVADLLEALRRLQDVEVAVEVRVVTVADSIFEPLCKSWPITTSGPPKTLSTEQVARLLEEVQSDRRTDVVQAPKLTVFNGQESTITCVDEQPYVTELQCVAVNGQRVYVPKTEKLATGFRMTVRPTVTPDRKSVIVQLDAEQRELAENPVPLFPVTAFITPILEGSAQGQPIPFTQFIQQPKIVTRRVTQALGLADGSTALLYGGRAQITYSSTDSVPVLGDIPFLGDLFKTKMQYSCANHLLLMVTPRVIINSEESERSTGVTSTPAKSEPAEEQNAPKPAPAVPCPHGCPAAAPCPAACPMPGPTPTPAPAAPPSDAPQVQLDVSIYSAPRTFMDGPGAAYRTKLAAAADNIKMAALTRAEAGQCEAEMWTGRQKHEVQLLAQPKLITLSGRVATFNSGGQQAVPEANAAGEITGTRFVEIGTQVTFLPIVLGNGKIYLEAEPVVSSLNSANGFVIGGIIVPGRTEQRARAAVTLEPGQTLLIRLADGPLAQSGKGKPPQGDRDLYVMLTPSVLGGPAASHVDDYPGPDPETMCSPIPLDDWDDEEQDAPPTNPVLLKSSSSCPAAQVTPQTCPAHARPKTLPAEKAVVADMCVLSMDPHFFDQPGGAAWKDLSPAACGCTPKFLSAEEAKRFCQTVKALEASAIVFRPQVMTLNGQTAAVNCGGEQKLVTGVTLAQRDGGGAAEPVFQTETRGHGVMVQVTPTFSADERFINLAMLTEVSTPGESQEYRVTVTPVSQTEADPPARTEILRRPVINVHQCETKVSVPTGRAVLHYVGQDKAGRELLLIVTLRIHDPATGPVPPPAP